MLILFYCVHYCFEQETDNSDSVDHVQQGLL